MTMLKLALTLFSSICLAAAPALAQFPGSSGGGGSSSYEAPPASESTSLDTMETGDKEPEKATKEAARPLREMGPTELDLPVDEKIKVRVEPFTPGSVVDRLLEPSTITVECHGAFEAELFVVPVDAPYGGKAIDRPRLIGKDNKPADGLKVHWSGKESEPYVKIFAVVHKKGFAKHRSRTLDFALAGPRLATP